MTEIVNLPWSSLVRGAWLGIGAAMPIGPVNVQIARRVLKHGLLAGATVGFGAVSVDVVYAIVSSFGIMQIQARPLWLQILGAAGVAFLAYLGGLCLRAAFKAWRHDPLAESDEPTSSSPTIVSGYLTGLLMTLLNPMTLIFWFVALPSVSASAGNPPGAQAAAIDLPMMSAGVFIGTGAWVWTFSGLLALASHRAGAREPGRRQKWLAVADLVGGVTLLAFAVQAALRLLGSVA